MLLHIRWIQAKTPEAEATARWPGDLDGRRKGADAQMEAAKAQAIASLKLPELREGEAAPLPPCSACRSPRRQLEEDANRILRRATN
jgi:chromosome segregation protein